MIRRAGPLFLILGAALAASGCGAPRARLEGRVMWRGEGLADAAVLLRDPASGQTWQTATDEDGVYSFAGLPGGAYRLSARREGPEALGALPGKIPLRLAPGTASWIGLQAVPWEAPVLAPAEDPAASFGTLSGVLRFEGEPVAGGTVHLYLDEEGGLRGPGFQQSFPTGPDGRFFLDQVPDGEYFLAARKRQDGAGAGPVREGDLYGLALSNPVPVRAGRETRLDLHLVRKERDDAPDEEALAFTGTGLAGRVVDAAGHPVAGTYVFAYRDRTIGHGKPDFLTLPTGEDGTFVLPTGDGGLVYVGARERSGGSPAPGEYFGFFEGSPDHGIVIPRGRLVEGVEIVVRKVLEP